MMKPKKRLTPRSLHPLSLDEALAGAMGVRPPKGDKPKKKAAKAKKKRPRKRKS